MRAMMRGYVHAELMRVTRLSRAVRFRATGAWRRIEPSCCCRPYDDPGEKRQARECENDRRITAPTWVRVTIQLGQLVSQADAARSMNVSPRSVKRANTLAAWARGGNPLKHSPVPLL